MNEKLLDEILYELKAVDLGGFEEVQVDYKKQDLTIPLDEWFKQMIRWLEGVKKNGN